MVDLPGSVHTSLPMEDMLEMDGPVPTFVSQSIYNRNVLKFNCGTEKFNWQFAVSSYMYTISKCTTSEA